MTFREDKQYRLPRWVETLVCVGVGQQSGVGAVLLCLVMVSVATDMSLVCAMGGLEVVLPQQLGS